jgi:hypothetical protein
MEQSFDSFCGMSLVNFMSFFGNLSDANTLIVDVYRLSLHDLHRTSSSTTTTTADLIDHSAEKTVSDVRHFRNQS